MSGLVLKLGPHERVLINGAVIENGARRRVCYIAQLVLSGDAERGEARRQLLRGIEQLSQVFTDADSRAQLATATDAVTGERFYPALKALRSLIPREDRLFAAAAAAAAAGAVAGPARAAAGGAG
jgi:flagellar biosynthesis repressor protein FlbT